MTLVLDAEPAWPPPPARAPTPLPDAWAGWVMLAVCALTPVLAYFGNLGFALLAALAGALCLPLLFKGRKPSLGLAILAGLTVWAVVSAAWSPIPLPAAGLTRAKTAEQVMAFKLPLELALYGAFVVGALRLTKDAGARATLVLGVGLAILAALFLFDSLLNGAIYKGVRSLVHQTARPDLALRDMSRASYVLALLFWPVALRFEKPWMRFTAAGLVVATLIGAFVLNADAPFASLAVSGAVFFAVRQFGRPALIALLVGVIAYFLAAPLLIALVDQSQLIHPAANDIRVQSWAIRLDIWRFAEARIHEKPFWGWGLDAARTFAPNIPLHTHNAAMQLWLELGGVGAMLACLFWCWIVVQLDRLEAVDRPLAAACAGAAAAYLTIGALSFGVWQEWWLGLGALTAAVCIALAKARAIEEPAEIQPSR